MIERHPILNIAIPAILWVIGLTIVIYGVHHYLPDFAFYHPRLYDAH